jgi:hypothetical protein
LKSTRTANESFGSIGRTAASGTTFAPFRRTPPKIGESMSSPAGSPVRTSVMQGRASASKDRGRDYGLSFQGSFAYFDRGSSSWRTYQKSLFQGEGLELFSETWPRWGLMRNGVACRRRRLAPRISVRGSSLLPTPKRAMAEGSAGGKNRRADIRDHVGTPTATMHKRGYTNQSERGLLGPQDAGGPINPAWIEHLMGFPIGFTDCEP